MAVDAAAVDSDAAPCCAPVSVVFVPAISESLMYFAFLYHFGIALRAELVDLRQESQTLVAAAFGISQRLRVRVEGKLPHSCAVQDAAGDPPAALGTHQPLDVLRFGLRRQLRALLRFFAA